MRSGKSVLVGSMVARKTYPRGLARWLGACACGLGLVTHPFASAQAPERLGPVFTVRTTTGSADVEYPKVAVDSDGDFMVVWRDEDLADEIRGRIYDQAGAPLGDHFVIQDPGTVAADDFDVKRGIQDVAAAGSDGFVVVFNGRDESNECDYGPCVFSRRYDGIGAAGTQFRVQGTTYPTYQAGNPRVAENDAGQFVVAWEALESTYYYGTTESEDVFGRTLDSDGAPASAKFQVNETFIGYQGDSGFLDVAGGPDGAFVVAWDDEYEGIGFRFFSSSGTARGPERFAEPPPLDPFDTPPVLDPVVAYEANGNFLIVWEDVDLDAIRGRTFDPNGTPFGPAFTISSDISPTYPRAAVAGFPHDSFIVVWNAGDEIRGQLLNRTGAAVGPTFLATDTQGFNPDVDVDAAGNFTLVWENGSEDILGQRFRAARLDFPLATRRLRIRDRVPDVAEKRKIEWVVKDASIVPPEPGSSADPRCNGDPTGTVKASVRFFSDDSGHDTGTIALPCQGWTSFGQGDEVTYGYKDRKLVDGPCPLVHVKAGKRLKVKCGGKGLATTLYDLEVGTPEGTVQVVLDLGGRAYCGATSSFRTKDGSDGKLFMGKDGLPPASCP